MAKKKSDAGKGDAPRENENLEAYREHYDKLNWTKNEEYIKWLHESWPIDDIESE